MSKQGNGIQIDWKRLLKEFQDYQIDEDLKHFKPQEFVKSIISPRPHFVKVFLKAKKLQGVEEPEAVRDLYGFLLEKRYYEKLNLLHFAFEIFDESFLPKEIIDKTPLPHEEGIPLFKYRFDPDFELTVDL